MNPYMTQLYIVELLASLWARHLYELVKLLFGVTSEKVMVFLFPDQQFLRNCVKFQEIQSTRTRLNCIEFHVAFLMTLIVFSLIVFLFLRYNLPPSKKKNLPVPPGFSGLYMTMYANEYECYCL